MSFKENLLKTIEINQLKWQKLCPYLGVYEILAFSALQHATIDEDEHGYRHATIDYMKELIPIAF